MTAPKRIQRRRTRGWTTPVDEQGRKPVYVGRGSRWGNPWAVVQVLGGWGLAYENNFRIGIYATREEAVTAAVEAYTEYARDRLGEIQAELAGRDLMCWCPLDAECHADVLLALAAGGEDRA